MTEQEKQWFDILRKDREENAAVLEKPSMCGAKQNIEDPYSDPSHFVYELLQNADDAGATEVHFLLKKDKLQFSHNGSKHFTITDPMCEGKGTGIGDINAITAIGNTSKRDGTSIGEFGVGFKSVYQYTTSPYIYDIDIAFKIERFVVPTLLSEDYASRKPSETLFVFPFNHPGRSKEEAFSDIYRKLHTLKYPILFLSNLKYISFEIENGETSGGLYEKEIVEEGCSDNTKMEKIVLTQTDGEVLTQHCLWLFTRDYGTLHYSVGFFLGSEGHLLPVTEPAFCYFPTKAATGLKFMIHAPFDPTNNREGIKAGSDHNKTMIDMLAQLAADSILLMRDIPGDPRLIDDNILSIIPVRKQDFDLEDGYNSISFLPFYTKIKFLFETERILPTIDGYTSKDYAYWADTEEIAELFSDDQLSALTHDSMYGKQSHWVFRSKGRNSTYRNNKHTGLCDYIDDLIHESISEEIILFRLAHNSSFMQGESKEWMIRLYKYILQKESRIRRVRTAAIFWEQNMEPVSAYAEDGHATLFLPSLTEHNYPTIHADLYAEEATRELLKRLDVQEPLLKDLVYVEILPRYDVQNGSFETQSATSREDLRAIFHYYTECTNAGLTDDVAVLLEKIKFLALFMVRSYDGTQEMRAAQCADKNSARFIYWPSKELKQYFGRNSDVAYLDIQAYSSAFDPKLLDRLKLFLEAVGIQFVPARYECCYGHSDIAFVNRNYGSEWPRYSVTRKAKRQWHDYRMHGAEGLIRRIQKAKSKGLSVLLWEQLSLVHDKNTTCYTVLGGIHEYPDNGQKKYYFDGLDTKLFRNSAWLFDCKDQLVSPGEVSLQTLAPEYRQDLPGVERMIDFLQIKNDVSIYPPNMTDRYIAKIQFAEKIQAIAGEDISVEYIVELLRQNPQKLSKPDESTAKQSKVVGEKILAELGGRIKSEQKKPESEESHATKSQEVDSDGEKRQVVDVSGEIEREKTKYEEAIKLLETKEAALESAQDAEKYSFAWFKALLELEAIENGENNANSREVSISFGLVERELGSEKTLILKQPSKGIPAVLEELVDIPLKLTFADKTTKQLIIDGINIKSYTIRVKLKTSEGLDEIDYHAITEAKIDAINPSFLLRELQKQFCKLELEEEDNLKDMLCKNIQFVFGPPGTGKTTYLARDVLIPEMKKPEPLRILVLAPTNKAADVLVSRIMQCMGDDASYLDWLIRFGITADETIEQSGVFHDKRLDLSMYPRCVLATTMARFPYDYLIGDYHAHTNICNIDWDYIVVDEASMIPLIQMVFVLYKKQDTTKQFIIAGDPFQIEPTFSVSQWKDENIYTMVELESFTDPKTRPHQYPVKLLTTQYRSIPTIGQIFSQLTYGGVLKHARKDESRRPLHIDGCLDYDSLNLIKFPVKRYESIYRAKKLQTSNYQAYSALFAYEFVCYLATILEKENKGQTFQIGVISPYRAQAGLIDKLVVSAHLPASISVTCSTVNAFQGDECDIVLAVFNPPPRITRNKEMFLNRKNLINVAISRAKDYLFILMPDDDTENVEDLFLVKRVEKLITETSDYVETKSNQLEEVIFHNPSYIEENSFATGHQFVNVYGTPERRYEIRSEENAVDVQIH